MTVFDIMPVLWLGSSFLFCLFYLFGKVDFSLCAFCGAMLSFVCALFGITIYIQSAVFLGVTFFVLVLSLIAQAYYRKKSTEEYVAVALTDITARGGYVKCRGNIFCVKSRDAYIKYRKGDVFLLKIKDGHAVMWAKYG